MRNKKQTKAIEINAEMPIKIFILFFIKMYWNFYCIIIRVAKCKVMKMSVFKLFLVPNCKFK